MAELRDEIRAAIPHLDWCGGRLDGVGNCLCLSYREAATDAVMAVLERRAQHGLGYRDVIESALTGEPDTTYRFTFKPSGVELPGK